MPAAKFSLGQIVITPHAQEALHPEDVRICLECHAQGDRGSLYKSDHRENKMSLNRNLRLFSAFRDRNKTRFWIITDADCSVTTILLPEDY